MLIAVIYFVCQHFSIFYPLLIRFHCLSPSLSFEFGPFCLRAESTSQYDYYLSTRQKVNDKEIFILLIHIKWSLGWIRGRRPVSFIDVHNWQLPFSLFIHFPEISSVWAIHPHTCPNTKYQQQSFFFHFPMSTSMFASFIFFISFFLKWMTRDNRTLNILLCLSICMCIDCFAYYTNPFSTNKFLLCDHSFNIHFNCMFHSSTIWNIWETGQWSKPLGSGKDIQFSTEGKIVVTDDLV